MNNKHQGSPTAFTHWPALLLGKRLWVCMAGAVLLMSPALVSAQKLVDISSCAGIAKDAERFACYDNLARQAGMPPATASTPVTPAEAVSAAPAKTPQANPAPAVKPVAKAATEAAPPVSTSSDPSRIAAFGAAISKALLQTDKAGQEMLMDTVTGAKYYKPYIWQVTLSSGQIWRQMNAGEFMLRVGDTVQIVPTGWGNSYRLSVKKRSGFIQVERLDNKVGN